MQARETESKRRGAQKEKESKKERIAQIKTLELILTTNILVPIKERQEA